MKVQLFGGIAVAALAVAVPAIAQVAPAPMPAPRAAMDHAGMNHKVQLRAQVQAKVAEHFARLDVNRDGSLTREEANAGAAAMGKGMRERFAKRLAERGPAAHGAPGEHVGGNVFVHRVDGGARGPAAFDRIDANKDGMISRQEFDAGQAVRVQRMARKDRTGARGEGGNAQVAVRRMHGGMHGMGGRMFEVADANRDGRVTLQEATASALQRFDTADVNRDGQLTHDERMQVRQRIRVERRRG